MDGADVGRWMTFAELSQARGISLPSARKLVRRHQWRRQTGNQGIVRILVPADALDRPRDDPGADPLPDPGPAPSPDHGPVLRPDPGADPSDTQRAITALEASVTVLREQLDRAEAGRETERNRADRAENRADQAESRADRSEQALTGERIRADELRNRLDDLTAKLTDAQAELAAAQADIEQVAQGRETAEARGDELRTQLDEMQAQLAARQEAIDATEAVRQADDARQGRGRWARLRAAWRGD
jgi:hypothetical protein